MGDEPQQWDRFWREGDFARRHTTPPEYMPELVTLFRKRRANSILDLGCGTGRVMAYLVSKGFLVVGQDISPLGLGMAQRAMSSASTRNFVLVNHDVTVLPFPDRSFDAVISINAIHHNRLRDIKRAVKEIYRVLSPKGLLFVNLTARAEIRDGEKVERGTYRTRDGTEKGILHHLFTASEIRSTFKDYRILQLTPPSEGKPHWLLLAEKR